MTEPETAIENPPAQSENQTPDSPAVDTSQTSANPSEPPEANESSPAEANVAAESSQIQATAAEGTVPDTATIPTTNSQAVTDDTALPETREPTTKNAVDPDSIEVKENEAAMEDEKSAVDFLLGDDQKHSPKDSIISNADHSGTDGQGSNMESRSVTSEVLTEVDYSVQTALADADENGEPESAVLDKQPAIGQLQLKELLSGTSIKIVEHAKKLAEAPLIGTVVPPQENALPSGSTASPQAEPSQIPPSSRSSRTAPGTHIEERVTGEPRIQEAEGEDRFPGPDYEDGSRSVAPQPDLHPLLLQDPEEKSDLEPYEMYTIPENADKEEEVPAVLKRYMRTYQDDKESVAKMFKMEDEDKLNEAVCLSNLVTFSLYTTVSDLHSPTPQ